MATAFTALTLIALFLIWGAILTLNDHLAALRKIAEQRHRRAGY